MMIIEKISDLSINAISAQIFELLEASYEFGSPWNTGQLAKSLNDKSNHFFFILERGKLAGFLHYTYILDQADIMNLAIHPDFQQKGLAGQLMNLLEERLQHEKVKEIFLEVRKSNIQAQNFYQKQGFQNLSQRPNYYQNPSEDALILKKELL